MNGTLFIDGIGFWSPTLPGWQHACRALRGEAVAPDAAASESVARPSPSLLAANERRRAPDAVLVAIEVARAATEAAGQDPAQLASVFTSAHGDLAIVDALCSMLAQDPLALSPLRFHHSVHNAAAGYWSIATGCRAASSAVSAFEHSFAAGWLEAGSQVAADEVPVLLVGVDTEARGALASVTRSRGLLGVALVLAPRAGPRTLWQVHVDARPAPPKAARTGSAPRSAAGLRLADNALADALPLFEALAAGGSTSVALALGPKLQLDLSLTPHRPVRAERPAA